MCRFLKNITRRCCGLTGSGLFRASLALLTFSVLVVNFVGANNIQRRLKSAVHRPVYTGARPINHTAVSSLLNGFNYQRQLVATPKVDHQVNAGKITLKKVEYPHVPTETDGWGWKGKEVGWGWEEKEESHHKPEGWGWKEEESHKKPEGWGWKEEEEEDEFKKLVGVVGPLLFPIPFFLASLPLAIPAIGLTVLGKRRNITFQSLKPSTNTETAGEGRQTNVYTILKNT